MTDAPAYDAIVIGGGVNGLAAAAYLARAGRRTLLLEARDTLGGLCQMADIGQSCAAPAATHALYALDARVTSELKLTRHGLKFVLRDAPVCLLRDGAEKLVLSRNVRASARSIAAHSKADADVWPRYRSELLALGRAMRAQWWEAGGEIATRERFEHAARIGTAAWLDSRFESDALKSLLAFDASALSPLDAGSSLLLVWRSAQEMCGLQAAAAFPTGGPGALVSALGSACEAAGVEIRTRSEAASVVMEDDRVTGVQLASGEVVASSLVLSSASRRRTLLNLANGAGVGFAERKTINVVSGVAAAKINLALDRLPDASDVAGILKGRLILAERLESYAVAHADSRAGRISDELVMEVMFPTVFDPTLATQGGHAVSILVQPVPRDVAGGWDASKAKFTAKVLAKLNHHLPGLVKHIVAADVLTPDVLESRYAAEFGDIEISRMLADWPARVRTNIDGLFLCGADADVVPSVSGRAGRIAATLAMAGAR